MLLPQETARARRPAARAAFRGKGMEQVFTASRLMTAPSSNWFGAHRGAQAFMQKGADRSAPLMTARKTRLLGGFAVLSLLLFGNDFLTGGLIDNLHGEANLAALIEAHQLDPDLVAFLDDVRGLGNALGSQLRDMNEAVAAPKKLTKAPKSAVFTTVPS